jgi:tRNA uridine 5-carboxymethylaminomethyl modification enzyme
VSLLSLIQHIPVLLEKLSSFSAHILEQTEIQIKYERYIEKEQQLAEKMSQMEELIIPDSFDYDKIAALSKEAHQKFKRIKPRTLGQASRISGVNPSDIQILMVYMGR